MKLTLGYYRTEFGKLRPLGRSHPCLFVRKLRVVFVFLNGHILNGYISTYIISILSLGPQSLSICDPTKDPKKFVCPRCSREPEGTYCS